MVRGHLVKKFWLHELQAWLKQLCSDDQGKHTAHQEHGKTEPQIKGTNVLMVGRKQPTLQTFCWAMVVVVVMICVNNFAHDYSLLTVR
jgi:hypothetical protein